MIEYVIQRNGYYIQESHKFGMFFSVKQLDKASTFPSVQNAIKFINDDMRLNVKNVSIIEVKTVTTQTELVKVGDEWLDIDDCFQCAVCQTWHKQVDENTARFKLGASVCPGCRDDGN